MMKQKVCSHSESRAKKERKKKTDRKKGEKIKYESPGDLCPWALLGITLYIQFNILYIMIIMWGKNNHRV